MYKEYAKRLAVCILGLALYGLGNAMGVKAGAAGTNAWASLSLGVSSMANVSFGTATFLTSLVVILVDLVGRGKLGLGTVLNALLIPVFSDMFLAVFAFMPNAGNGLLGVVISLLGQVVISFATIYYMRPALGCGPRDTLLVIVGRRFPKAPIGTVKFGIEMVVLLVGFLLGAPFGLGTVLVIVLQASIFQLVCRICRYEPRDVVHEDLVDTAKRVFART